MSVEAIAPETRWSDFSQADNPEPHPEFRTSQLNTASRGNPPRVRLETKAGMVPKGGIARGMGETRSLTATSK